MEVMSGVTRAGDAADVSRENQVLTDTGDDAREEQWFTSLPVWVGDGAVVHVSTCVGGRQSSGSCLYLCVWVGDGAVVHVSTCVGGREAAVGTARACAVTSRRHYELRSLHHLRLCMLPLRLPRQSLSPDPLVTLVLKPNSFVQGDLCLPFTLTVSSTKELTCLSGWSEAIMLVERGIFVRYIPNTTKIELKTCLHHLTEIASHSCAQAATDPAEEPQREFGLGAQWQRRSSRVVYLCRCADIDMRSGGFVLDGLSGAH